MTSAKQMIVTLFIVALVCSIVLSFVYSFTSPRIANTQSELTLAGLKEVSAAQEFVEIIPDTLWRALDSSGNCSGIVFRVFPQGYGGPIPITVGIDLDGKITGIRIASAAEGMKETPGLGAKITEKDFIEQFKGKEASEVPLKKDGGEIDAITAATISSRAVCDGIKTGIEKYTSYLGAVPNKVNVFPAAQEFVEIVKEKLWYALSDTDTLGIVFISSAQGYSNCITFMVGVDNDGEITGVEIVYSNETPGIGDKIREREFLDKFTEGMPEAITGATISSKALIEAVKNDIELYQEYLK